MPDITKSKKELSQQLFPVKVKCEYCLDCMQAFNGSSLSESEVTSSIDILKASILGCKHLAFAWGREQSSSFICSE